MAAMVFTLRKRCSNSSASLLENTHSRCRHSVDYNASIPACLVSCFVALTVVRACTQTLQTKMFGIGLDGRKPTEGEGLGYISDSMTELSCVSLTDGE